MSLRRNALLLMLATGALAIVGLWSGGALVRLWRIPAGLLLLGLAYEGWQASRTHPSVQLHTAHRWFLGRSTSLRLLLRHAQPRTLRLELAPAAPAEIAMSRAVRTLPVPGVLELAGTARRLGRFAWPPMTARIGGVLGLAWWSERLTPACEVQVVPDVLHASERAAGMGLRGEQAASRLGAGGEILQLREYRRGDPPRAIDWKASARRGQLISRDYSEDQHLEILLAVDAGRASGLRAADSDRLALYVNVAARFAERAVALDDQVGLIVYAERPLAAIAAGRGTAALIRLRTCLAAARVHDGDGNPALAALQARALLQRRSLVIFLTDVDEPGALGHLVAAARLLLPKHLPFIAGVESEGARRLASAPAADELAAYRALAAQEYRASVARNVRALQALGAAAVLAPSRALEQAVLDAYVRFRERRRVG